MNPVRLFCLCFLSALVACGGSTPAPATASTASTQAIARGALELAEHLWQDAAGACLAAKDAGATITCSSALLPARDSLVVAASAVDAWTATSSGHIACAIGDVVEGVQALAPELHPTSTEVAMLASAGELVNVLGGCSKDGGK